MATAVRARPRKQATTLTLKQAARRAKVSPEHMNLLALCGAISFEYTERKRFEKRISAASLNQFLKREKP